MSDEQQFNDYINELMTTLSQNSFYKNSAQVNSLPNPLEKSLKSQAFRDILVYNVDPNDHPLSKFVRRLIWDIYTKTVYKAIYVSTDYLKIVTDSDDKNTRATKIDHFISSIISAYLISGASTLIEGSPGCGKTSTVQSISRLMTGSSIKEKKNIVHCNKNYMAESWLGMIDPSNAINPNAKPTDKKWDIIWADWVTDPDIVDFIFDEINRASGDIQNQLLLLMQESMVQYSVQFNYNKPDIRLFLTRNPKDEDAINLTDLGFAFKDRIMQVIQLPQAPSLAMERVDEVRGMERILGFNIDEELEPIMNPNLLRIGSILSQKIKISTKAMRFIKYLARDSNLCIRAPKCDKSHLNDTPFWELCEGCHYNVESRSVCQKISGGSMRIQKHLAKLSRAYAFWLNMKEVTIDLVYAIAPDVVSHRLQIPMHQLKEHREKYYLDKRRYILEEYIDWCRSQVEHREPVEKAIRDLVNGEGKRSDLQLVLDHAQHDIYVRTDLLPYVIDTIESEIDPEINITTIDITHTQSCLDSKYIQYAKKINELENDKDLDSLVKLLGNVNQKGDIPMKIRLQDRLCASIHRLQMEG